MEVNCPQCGKTLALPSSRLVQDSCGHRKCRMCLLQDESECRMCLQQNLAENSIMKKSESSVIKYENNHAAVITCNKSVVRSVSEQSGHVNKHENDFQQVVRNTINKTDSSLQVKSNSKKESSGLKNGKMQVTGQKRTYQFITLPNHVLVLSENPLMYKCNICSKTFRTKSHVKYHIYCAGGNVFSIYL